MYRQKTNKLNKNTWFSTRKFKKKNASVYRIRTAMSHTGLQKKNIVTRHFKQNMNCVKNKNNCLSTDEDIGRVKKRAGAPIIYE